MDDGSRLWLLTVAAAFCILLMAFFTTCESAVVEVNDAKAKKNAETSVKWKRLTRLIEKPTRIILAMSVFRLFMTCAAAFLASAAWYSRLGGGIARLFKAGSAGGLLTADTAAVVIIVMIVTVLASAIGVNFPKKLGNHYSDDYALKFCGLLEALICIFMPLEKMADGIVYVLCKICGVKGFTGREAVTEEEILMMVDAVNETGGLETSQRDMISNIFEFGDLEIAEVMTHRTDICGVEVNSDIHDAIIKIIDEGFSRLPVYDKTIDDIIGVVFAKDLLSLLVHENASQITIRHLMRDILYVPETNSCDELFTQFTKNKAQIAVAVDEYGGTAGIVTMEDLLESIVGNIQDEYDDEDEEITELSDGSYKVLGDTSPDDVMELFGKTLQEDHLYDTIGGFVIDHLGYIPNDNETPEFVYEDLKLSVLKATDKKIDELKISKIEIDNSSEDEVIENE